MRLKPTVANTQFRFEIYLNSANIADMEGTDDADVAEELVSSYWNALFAQVELSSELRTPADLDRFFVPSQRGRAAAVLTDFEHLTLDSFSNTFSDRKLVESADGQLVFSHCRHSEITGFDAEEQSEVTQRDGTRYRYQLVRADDGFLIEDYRAIDDC